MSRSCGGRASSFALLAGAALLVVAPAVVAAGPLPIPTALSSASSAGSQNAGDAMDPVLQQVIGLYTGSTGQVDDPRAHELMLEAAADGDPLSQMWLARCYSRGRMLFEQDEAKARELADEVIDDVIRLAQANNPEAAFLLGTAFTEGFGVEINHEMSMAWYFRAADLGNMLAQHNLGNAYREGVNAPQDDGTAVYWYHRAAAQGDAWPAYWLGEHYERGAGVPPDMEAALRWYRDSAQRGNPDAKAALERLGG